MTGRRTYPKMDRQFKLEQDLTIPAGTIFQRAALERGGEQCIEAVVALGRDASAWLVLPIATAEFDATEWLKETTDR